MEKSACEKVLYFFEEINKIPRGSGNEKAISDYLVSFANERGLSVHQDEALNVIIKKPATKGMENLPPVCIQGHMDMVCEKNSTSTHNFLTDPIKVIYDGDFIHADGTTLGADDGIAVAMAMAVLDSNTLSHPRLEVLITTDEEVGMIGASKFDPQLIDSRVLLNIDSEMEGVFTVGCAGGCKTHSHIPVEYAENSKPTYKIKLSGLRGGHSGIEIHKERGNANKLICRLYTMLKADFSDLSLCEISGGAKDNAIPRESEISIATTALFEDLSEHISIAKNTFLNELQDKENNILISIEKLPTADRVFSEKTTQAVITFGMLVPNGVLGNNLKLEMPETSNNLGVIKQNNDNVEFICAIRSGVATLKTNVLDCVKQLTSICGGKIDVVGDYPAWEFKQKSPLCDLFVQAYKEQCGKEPVVETVHAGLECGLIGEKIPDMDMISFGPNLIDIHTPDEKAEISSIERVWCFLIKILEKGVC